MSNLERRLTHYKSCGVEFQNVLDIGAFKGEWTKTFKKFFPTSNVLMIEANEDHEEDLKNIGPYKIALLGKEDDKEVNYYKAVNKIQTGNSIYREDTTTEFTAVKKKTITLPSLLDTKTNYDLIKMDVQGSELDIIKGGLPIINNTTLLLLEVNLFEYNKGAPLIGEVMSYLSAIGFKLVDIVDLMYNQDNGYLLQIDAMFKKN